MYRWHISRAVPMRDGDGKIIMWVGSLIDIHEERLIQENLTSTNKELIKLNKDLDDFIYTASHDLRVPLANIQGLSIAMHDIIEHTKFDDSKELDIMLEMIDQSLKKQESVIMDLTEIGKIQRMKELNISELSISSIIDQSIENLNDLVNSSNATIIRKDKVCPKFNFPKSSAQIVLDTIIKNALLYKAKDRDLVIEIFCGYDEDYILLSIKDNGLGIKEEYQSKVFGLFKRLYTHVEGSGLGLYMAKQIMENSGGFITFKSEFSKGSEFTIHFSRSL